MAGVACTTASTTITSTTADGVIAIGSSVWGHLAALVVLTILLLARRMRAGGAGITFHSSAQYHL